MPSKQQKFLARDGVEAARSFHATELGIAFQHELRQSHYGRACGYDKSPGKAAKALAEENPFDKAAKHMAGLDQWIAAQ